MTRLKPSRWLTLLLACAVLCVVQDARAQAGETAFTPPPGYPPSFAPGVNPLTGLAADPAALNRPPLIVKISNAPDIVRPQDGIGAADVVFEHYAEGGLTRFSAIFLSESPARIGSVRSARLIDDELTPMFGALLAYSGASPGTEATLQAGEYANRLFSGWYLAEPYFFRDYAIAAPNNMFADPAAIWADAADDGVPPADLRGWLFADAPPPGGSPAGLLQVAYVDNSVSWVYDAAAGSYARFDDDLPHSDGLTGQQIHAQNVVLLLAEHLPTTIEEGVWNGQPYYGIDIPLTGEGMAVLLRDGQQYPVIWRRLGRDRLLSLWTADGQPMPLKPGRTWFQVFPTPEAWTDAESAQITAG